jgi:hypothetical protein
VTWVWRIQHNEKLHNLYSTNTIRAGKSRRMGLEKHKACMGERANANNMSTSVSTTRGRIRLIQIFEKRGDNVDHLV